jgi:hypothetical protein
VGLLAAFDLRLKGSWLPKQTSPPIDTDRQAWLRAALLREENGAL